MKKIIIRGIVFLFMSVMSMNLAAQSGKRVQKMVDKREEQLAKDKEAKKKEAEKQHEAKKKAHYDMQTKEVRKRMKKTQRKSRRNNDKKREFFIKRWFN